MPALAILSLLISLVSIACWIMVLVKIFQSGDTLWGILGICPLVAFIYGWVKNQALDIKNIMMVWTLCIIGSLILNFVAVGMGAGAHR